MKYSQEARHIWQTYVPARGQADTVQGKLLRAIEKLRDQAQRNGNMNWDKDFEILCDFIDNTLTKSPTIDEAGKKEISADMTTLRDYEKPYTADDLYDRLVDKAMEWCIAHPEPVAHRHDPNLHH